MNFIASSFSKLFENSSEGLIGKYDRVFVSQQHKWDCGLACCAMLLNWLELDSRGVYMSKESQRGSPLWSIELFCLLRSLDVPCDLYATSVSVEHHSQTDWYKPHIDSDRVAVEACRETARLKGWDSSIHLEKFAMCELKELLSTGFVCTVMLVHSPILLIDSVEDVDSSQSFVGHYIFVLSYDADKDLFSYLNPSQSYAEAWHISSDLLEAARSFPGSDHDIIICRRPQR